MVNNIPLTVGQNYYVIVCKMVATASQTQIAVTLNTSWQASPAGTEAAKFWRVLLRIFDT